MRAPTPLWVVGLDGLKAEQVKPERISLSDLGLLAELGGNENAYALFIAAICWQFYSPPWVSNAHAERTFLVARATAAFP